MVRVSQGSIRPAIVRLALLLSLVLAGSALAQAFFLPTGAEVHNTGDPRMVVDSRGGVHLTYPIVAGSGAVYAYCASACTEPEAFESLTLYAEDEGAVSTALIAVDASDRPHLLISAYDSIIYATCASACGEGQNWEAAVIYVQGDDWELTGDAFALDPQGRPRFLLHAYQAYLGMFAPDPGTMYFACDADCLDPTSWTGSVVSEQTWLEPTLRFDASGVAHVATAIPVDDIELVAYLNCAADCGNEEVDNWPGVGLAEAYSDRYIAEVSPTVSMAVGNDGSVRLAFLGADGDESFLGYFECLTDCTADDGGSWEGLMLLHSAEGSDLGDGISLVLDQQDRPRLAYTGSASILVAYCDGDCVGRDGPDDWSLVVAELASDIPPDDIFLYHNCTVGMWFLRQPALAIQPDGLPVVAYRAEDVSSGFTTPDPTKPACVAGVEMTMTRLAVLGSY